MVQIAPGRLWLREKKGVNYKNTFDTFLDLAAARLIMTHGIIWQTLASLGDISVAFTKTAIETDLDISLFPLSGLNLTNVERSTAGSWTVLK
jgi:hypothetical protein